MKPADIGLSKHVSRTIEVYNRYRSPEVTARLVNQMKDGFTIEFEGALCQSCGVQDYLEDFIHELAEVSGCVEVYIGKIEQTSLQSFKVYYKVRNVCSGDQPNERALFQEFLQEGGMSVEDYMASNPCTNDVIKFHFRTWLFERNSKKRRA